MLLTTSSPTAETADSPRLMPAAMHPASQVRARLLALVGALLALLTGCIGYHAKPLTPTATLQTIETRSLDDSQLKAFLAANQVTVTDGMRWDLRSLTLVAFYFHPDLDEARAAAAAASGGIITAGERPNPQVQPSIGYDTTTSPPWIPGLGLSWPIETAGKRGRRLDQARHLQRAAQLRVISTAWAVRVRVRRTLLTYVAAKRAEEILVRQSGLQDQIVQLLQRQLEAGAISPFELTQAHLAAANARLAADQARFQLASSHTALADALGVAPAAFDRIAPLISMEAVPPAPTPDDAARRQALVSRSDVLAALSEYEAAQSALQLEVAKQYPDIQLGPGYQYDQTDNKWTVGVAFNLPILSRNRGPIAEAEAHREQAAAHLAVVQTGALHEVSEAVATLAAARAKVATADTLLETARKEAQRSQQRFELGDISRQEVLTSQLEVVSAEVARSDAQLQSESAAGALEDAMQSPLGFEAIVLTNPRMAAKGVTPQP